MAFQISLESVRDGEGERALLNERWNKMHIKMTLYVPQKKVHDTISSIDTTAEELKSKRDAGESKVLE